MSDEPEVKRNEKGLFVPGTAPGPGRPEGSLSAIGKVKQIFHQNPDQFEDFIKEYIQDPHNRKHIVEMIDGKPQQDITSKGERMFPTPIMDLNAVPQDNSNKQDSEPE